ncbi:hypothetical protein CD351_06730 [Erythrobacter sp. KY5]|uniref:outer membrane protein n=1 Tax=Erythrobacter sp. KY5 TaxID=2011159 RepID=UPI000DBF1550|nr:outer membrane beta-barrel protein [Erythrobacter sp. KY5]AWW74121.1 hypothetical protein CD351_06730 [Erythrobacter sp. KY5]
MKYRSKLSIIPVALAALIAVPAAAQSEPGPYVGVSGGVSLPGNSTNEGELDSDVPATNDFAAIPAGAELQWVTDFDDGYTIAGQVGYAFENGIRIEAEGVYSRYDVGSHRDLQIGGANIGGVDSAILTRTAASPTNATVGEVLADGRGDVRTYGLFANVYYDFETGSNFRPYVGAGIGYQMIDVDYQPSGLAVADDDDGAITYQLMAGASFEVSSGVELFGQYTYRQMTDEADIPLTLLPGSLEVESQQSLVTAGVRIRF